MIGPNSPESEPTSAAVPCTGGFAASVSAPITTLAQRGDFLAVARARHRATPGFVVQARQRPTGAPGGAGIRVGYTCSKKVGNAVARNRAKRRLRALARLVLPNHARAGWDYVLIGRRDVTATRDFAALQADLAAALDKLHTGVGR